MKKSRIAIAALALTSIFSSGAMAKEVELTGCTKDGQQATLKVDVEGGAFTPYSRVRAFSLEELAQRAFERAASSMDGARFQEDEGYNTFMSNFWESLKGKELNDARFKLRGHRIVGGSCIVRSP